ncbi:MAG: tyrosine-type recombinase/integrase [Candidatus Aenigmarchaeota archaeon]|nr:tyrosine-type recombinase/integrase [Candidatus Aenigmarchaeota archaeon]
MYEEDEIDKRIDKMLESPEFTENQRKTVKRFDHNNEAEGISLSCRHHYISDLRTFAKFLNENGSKGFENITYDDIVDFMAWASKKYARDSIRNFGAAIKKLMRILGKWDVYHAYKIPRKKLRELPEVLTEDEVMKIAKAATDTMGRALVLLIYETGGRVGEIINLKVKDIEFTKHSARITLHGKTGDRVVPLIFSVEALQTWLNHHPLGNDGKAYVFFPRSAVTWKCPTCNTIVRREIKKSKTGRSVTKRYLPFCPKCKKEFDLPKPYVKMSRHGVRKRLVEMAERAGLNGKRIHPHLFRHSRFTHLTLKGLSDSVLQKLGGWRKREMLDVYTHLGNKDAIESVEKLYGIIPEDKIDDTPLKQKTCPRCRYNNSPTSIFCGRCSLALDIETALKVDEREHVRNEWMKVMMKDKNIRTTMIERTEQLMEEKLPKDFKQKLMLMLGES